MLIHLYLIYGSLMGWRQYSQKVKQCLEDQLNALQKVSYVQDQYFHEQDKPENIQPLSNTVEENINLKKSVALYKGKAKAENKKYWNERWRNDQLQNVNKSRKGELKRVNKDTDRLQGELARQEKEMADLRDTTSSTIKSLHCIAKFKTSLIPSRSCSESITPSHRSANKPS